MATQTYDVIVVGARCAGSSTARLMAQNGLDVLIVDRATFPSDTVSTHCITTGGCIQLQRWGLFDRVLATNVKHIKEFMLTMNGMEMANPLPGDVPGATSPRRTVLDKLLLDAALEAGASGREGLTVKDLLRDGDTVAGIVAKDATGSTVELRARIVVGADGVNSVVARAAGADSYHERESKGAGFYSYFSSWSGTAVELAFSEAGGVGVFPTNDDQVCIFAGRSVDEFPEYKRDVDNTFQSIVSGTSKRLGEWLQSAHREERFHGWTATPGYFRTPFGPGWALVGDAGYYKDPVTGHGITDAFRDAELLSNAVAGGLGGAQPLAEALAAYRDRRDEMSKDVYDATQDLAAFDPDDQKAIDAFMRFGAAVQKEALEIASF